MTHPTLQAIEARLRNATPGPWQWVNAQNDEPYNEGDFCAPSLRTVEHFGKSETVIKDGHRYTTFSLPKFIVNAEEPAENAADMTLIAHAPTDIAWLLSEHARLTARIAELEAGAPKENGNV